MWFAWAELFQFTGYDEAVMLLGLICSVPEIGCRCDTAWAEWFRFPESARLWFYFYCGAFSSPGDRPRQFL